MKKKELGFRKTLCIYNQKTLDGWMSAAIVKHWFYQQKENQSNSKVFKEVDVDSGTLDFLGWNHGDDIPDLSENDKIIMVDIAFPKEEMNKLFNRLGHDFIWIDHHVSAMKENQIDLITGIQDIDFAACELTWQYFFPYLKSDNNSPWAGMPEIVRLLGRYDCLGYEGTDEEQKVLEFQYGARARIVGYESAYNWLNASLGKKKIYGFELKDRRSAEEYLTNLGSVIYSYLDEEAKQTYAKAFPIVLKEPFVFDRQTIETASGERITVRGKTKLIKRKFLCVNQEEFNPINFGIDYHKDGYDGFVSFWYENLEWHFKLYNENGEVDVSQIVKSYGGSGCKGTAEFVTNYPKDFINKGERALYLEDTVYEMARDHEIVEGANMIRLYLPNGYNSNGDYIKLADESGLYLCTNPKKIKDRLWTVNAIIHNKNFYKRDVEKINPNLVSKGARYEFQHNMYDEL